LQPFLGEKWGEKLSVWIEKGHRRSFSIQIYAK
jgi:hypothetical protein